ncbi:aspartoacylase [Leptolyngbya sp. 7M]|uniref:aspartoacylase n=1 Tax=Leptolyngbya sp. 7M TaxID=2812896 RepID=UPI001B8C1479|nr:aspartoacylase [Leptolyngbya sp. 7M]QYO68036.1 aspartoacylase [Leptolyngbya sp. 7M]
MSTVKRVAIVGGTHGNERTGVQLIKKFKLCPDHVRRSSFSTQVLLANPQAVAAGLRYIDRDLNRSFERDRLQNQALANYEDRRAKEISQMLGSDSSAPVDVILDMHSTTSNSGLTLIIDEENAFTLQLATYLQQIHSSVKIYSTSCSGREQDALRSLAKFGFCLEIGPVAQNVLNADLFQKTETLIHIILDYLEQYNRNEVTLPDRSLTLYRYLEAIDYPRNEHGEIQAMIHPQLQFKDYEALHPGDAMFLTFEGETINYSGTSVVYPVFINEAAYYEKGIAMCLTKKAQVIV